MVAGAYVCRIQGVAGEFFVPLLSSINMCCHRALMIPRCLSLSLLLTIFGRPKVRPDFADLLLAREI